MLAKLSVKREKHWFISSNPSCYYQTCAAWIDISKPSLRVGSGFVNPLRAVIDSI